MARIESYVEPATLYRYRSIKGPNLDREIDAIRQRSLHCAPYLSMNDPMEGFYATNRLHRANKRYDIIRAQIADGKKGLGICSFSEVHNNEIMWAHYADQFMGICIAYRFRGLLSGLDEPAEFVRLSYQDKAPGLRLNEDIELSAKRFLSCKSYKWLYEREWRLFAKKGMVTYQSIKCVRRVYLGSRISDENKTAVMSQLNSLGIETQIMSIDEYSMAFQRCD